MGAKKGKNKANVTILSPFLLLTTLMTLGTAFGSDGPVYSITLWPAESHTVLNRWSPSSRSAWRRQVCRRISLRMRRPLDA